VNRRIAVLVVASALAVPGVVSAKVDATCPPINATTAVAGVVQDAFGTPVPGLTVRPHVVNNPATLADFDVTDAQGRYRICIGEESGQGHNAYDIYVRDENDEPLFATVNQPYTTVTNMGDADFTPATGLPVLYTTNLSIVPQDISTATSGRLVEFVVRSKAPASTTMELTLEHLPAGPPIDMPADGTEGGGPLAGGWNRWKHSVWFAEDTGERQWWADLVGKAGSLPITQADRVPYVVDNTPPLINNGSTPLTCDPGVVANPLSPPETTNPQPVVTQGACDKFVNNARSGLNPFSLTGKICPTSNLSNPACEAIHPVLDEQAITWLPPAPLALGDHYLGWTIRDYAGNQVSSPVGKLLRITDSGGQTPVINGLQPGNLGQGQTLGVVIGATPTTPSSAPYIGFKVTDADGYRDIAPGSVTLRVYYQDENALVYVYDPAMGPFEYDPVTKRGGADFDLTTGVLRASYRPQGAPPGRYLASASATDHGGNSVTMSWHWLLVAAV